MTTNKRSGAAAEARSSKRIYYELIFKKGMLALPRFVLALAVTAALLLAAALAMFAVTRKDQLTTSIRVGAVIPEGDLVTAMGASLVENMESVKSLCTFVYMNDEEADRALRAGEVEAVIYLTPNIYDDVNSGRNTPIRIRIPEDSGLGVQLFQDLLAVGVSMLQIGESAVYSLDDISTTYELNYSVGELMDGAAMNYMSLAMNREGAWVNTLLSDYGSITMNGFYAITAILAAVCLFLGIGFSGLYDQGERALELCLSRSGVSTLSRTLARLLTMSAALWVLLVVVFVPVACFTDLIPFSAGMIPGLIPTAICMAAFIHLVYSLFGGNSQGLFFLLITVLMFILGSGLFPASSLPVLLQKVSGILPVRIWQKYLSDLFWNGFSARSFAVCLAAAVVMAAAGFVGLKIHEKNV